MELLAAFLAGWFLGSRAGRERLDELTRAWRALRATEEFEALVRAARAHLASALRDVADALDRQTSDGPEDLVARVRALFDRT